jgi:hypothetical protein
MRIAECGMKKSAIRYDRGWETGNQGIRASGYQEIGG